MKPCYIFKFGVLVALVGFNGATLLANSPTELKPIPRIETSSPDGVVVSSATSRWSRGRLLVSGSVTRKAGYSYPGPAQSHLDFIVLDSKNLPLSLTRVNYLPRTIPIVYRGIPARSSYADYLPILPPAGATVRVAHHQTSVEECQQIHPAADSKKTSPRTDGQSK